MPFIFLLLLFILYVISPFPHWPSWVRCCLETIKGDLPRAAKYSQFIFLFSQLAMAPFHGLAALIDDIFYSQYNSVGITPIFIIGQPRCGSTLLHRTMALSGEHLTIRHYQWRYPFVCFLRLFRVLGLDKFFSRISYWPVSSAGTQAKKMHPNNLADWEEDGIFFEEKLCHHFFMFLRFPYDGILQHACDYKSLSIDNQLRFLREHKRAIQKIACAQNLQQVSYLSKEVVSPSMIPDIINVYPNARFIVVVRESSEFLSSLIPLVRFSTATKNKGYDPSLNKNWQDQVVRKFEENCEILCNMCEYNISSKHQFLIHSNQLFGDIDLTIKSIYNWLRIDLTNDFKTKIELASKKQHQRNKGYENEELRINYYSFARYDEFVRSILSNDNNSRSDASIQV